MKRYDVICPVCGKKNKDLYLDETGGWMECERCNSKVKVRINSKIQGDKQCSNIPSPGIIKLFMKTHNVVNGTYRK